MPPHVSIVALCCMAAVSLPTQAAENGRIDYAIAIHGGAGSWSSLGEDDRLAAEAELRRVVALGRDMLAAGDSSLDVVERVVAELEDSRRFNAGRGATFNALGQHELDASIMDGRNLACGAVAGVNTVKNPVRLARAVMTQSKHVMLIGTGAEAFAESHGLEQVSPDYFWTPEQRERWRQAKLRPDSPGAKRPAAEPDASDHHGTVGCVALDRAGHLAAATSTGGVEAKLPGRVGDSPVIGAGTYADDASCAVSCTGVGEEFIRRAIAYDIAARIRYGGASLETAVASQFDERLKPNDGGLIAVDRHGRIAIRFNTKKMARATADASGRLEATLGP